MVAMSLQSIQSVVVNKVYIHDIVYNVSVKFVNIIQ